MTSSNILFRVIARYRQKAILENLMTGEANEQELKPKDDVVLGDIVSIDPKQGNRLTISPRKTLFKRCYFEKTKAICANVDTCLIISAPDKLFNPYFIDRAIAASLDAGVRPLLMFNKQDLGYSSEEFSLITYYQDTLEVPGIVTSSTKPEFKREILDFFLQRSAQHILFTGVSGVGKSSSLNIFIKDPDKRLRTGAMSTKSGLGKNTTTNGSAYYLAEQGLWLYDTPGLQSFGISHIELNRLPFFFSDILKLAEKCKFRDCIHFNKACIQNEILSELNDLTLDNCAVSSAVENQILPKSRYISWLSTWQEIYRAERNY